MSSTAQHPDQGMTGAHDNSASLAQPDDVVVVGEPAEAQYSTQGEDFQAAEGQRKQRKNQMLVDRPIA